MRSKTFFRALCAALLACVLLVGCAKAETTDYSAAKNGTVVVYEYVAVEGQPVIAARGSGFFVGESGEAPQYLITNHHVVEEYLRFGAGERGTATLNGVVVQLKSYVRVYFDSDDYVEAYVVDYNEAQDIALLRLDQPTEKRQALRLCVPTDADVGKTVYAVGFPGLSDNAIIDPTTTWGLSDITITRGSISRLTTTSGSGVRRVQTDTVIQHGNSGGPLVNENGSVVGVNALGVSNTDSEETNYAVNIEHVITMLELHGIAYEMEGKGGAAVPVWLIAVVLVVVAAAAVILVVVLTKKGGKTARPKQEEQPAAPAQPAAAVQSVASAEPTAPVQPVAPAQPAAPVQPVAPAQPAAPVQPVAPAQLVTPAQPVTPEQPAAPTAPAQPVNPNDSGYRLQGVSGSLAGRRLMLRKEGKLKLGRDAQQCNVVFPMDTPGVSGKHCEVWVDNGCVYIQDIGSRHGTFLAPGRKLAANQAIQLQPGDKIWLGSEAQTLQLVQKGGA